jgi:hypothetical protein
MAAKSLRSELIVGAKDQTGAAFDAVGRRFDMLAVAGKRVDGVARDFLQLGTSVDNAGKKLDQFERRLGRIDALGKSLGRSLGPLAAGAAAFEAAHLTRSLAERAGRAAIAGQHERVRMETAGMSPGEIAAADAAASGLSAKYTPLSQTTLLHMLRNTRSIVGNYEDAAKVIDPLAKLRIVAQGAHPEQTEELEGDFDKLVKGLEIKGVTQDLPKFTKYIDGMAKALNVFGDTLRPTDYYEMFKYGRAATQSLSDQFMLSTAPTFAQEMGGSSAGKAFGTAYATIVGGRIKAPAVNELNRLGLLDQSKVKISNAGLVTSWGNGAVKGWELFAQDPYRWTNEIFLPALRKKGITDKATILQEISTVFRDQTAAQLVSILATQQSRIEKDWHLVGGAQGLEAADAFMDKDVGLAWAGLTEQMKNFLQIAGGPMAAPAAHFLHELALGTGYLADAARQHPAVQAAASTGLTGALAGGSMLAWWASLKMLEKFTGVEGFGSAAKWPFKPFGWAGSLLRSAPGRFLGPLGMLLADTQPAGESDADERKRRIDDMDLQISGRAPSWLNTVGGLDQYLTEAKTAYAPELKGNATMDVTIHVPDWLEATVETSGRIGGVTIRGSTGDRGKSWPDAAPGTR